MRAASLIRFLSLPLLLVGWLLTPASASAPAPTIVIFHGWGGDKTSYEARDAQYPLGLLADEGLTNPTAIGVTGISYGGGVSLKLAYLRNRVRIANGTLTPWTSPKGTSLSIAADHPRWEWSDLASSLIPNGRFLDFNPATNGLSRNPIGVPIRSYLTGLFALGFSTGYSGGPQRCCSRTAGPTTSSRPLRRYVSMTRARPSSTASRWAMASRCRAAAWRRSLRPARPPLRTAAR